MDKLLKAALKYNKNGFKVIFTNATKRPAIKGGWSKYRTKQNDIDIVDMYNENKADIKGLAVLCTDGMEVIDIDQKYSLDGQLMSDYIAAVAAQIGEDVFFDGITISVTQSGGAHIIYRTDIAEGNQKLASREAAEGEESQKVLLETRGIGGYIVVPPSPGYKFDICHKDIAPKISNEWRNILINTARTFDQLQENHSTKNIAPTPIEITGPHKTTIEAFNETHTAFEMLEGAGWQYAYTRGENELMVRPGKHKRDGISASYNTKLRLAYIFTTSSQFDSSRAYNAFQVFSILNHNGDYSAAAKDLYRSGYGDRMTVTRDSDKTKQSAVLSSDTRQNAVAQNLMEQIFATRFDVTVTPPHVEYCLTYKDPLRTKPYNIAAYGDLVTICGKQKSRKSSFASSMVASALAPDEKEVLRFTLNNKGRKIVYLDTEQTDPENYRVQRRMKGQAGLPKNENQDNYYNWCIAGYTTLERVAFFTWLVEEKLTDIGLIYIDGLVDMCKNYNDLEESQALVGKLKYLAVKYKILIITVLHDAKTTGELRGHLGTELLNKSKAIIRVKKDAEAGFSTVNFSDLREEEPNDFDFEHDANGNLVVI